MVTFDLSELDKNLGRQAQAARVLLGWSEWDLAEASGFTVSVDAIRLFESNVWSSDRQALAETILQTCRAAGAEFLADSSGVRLPRPIASAHNAPVRPPPGRCTRTLCVDGDYSIEVNEEYAWLRWPGGIYDVGVHYGNCTCALISAEWGWCVTGGYGLVVTLFEGGFPKGRASVDPQRVHRFDVARPPVPTNTVREQAAAKGNRGVDAVWQKFHGDIEPDVICFVIGGNAIYELDLRRRSCRLIR